mmetsp:Transcript_28178/g.58558  ORF Transcript_28178/g.58558 Transcript_28178/m.58558 type:complete len:498 (+) Transcript_28178:125-1618(+)
MAPTNNLNNMAIFSISWCLLSASSSPASSFSFPINGVIIPSSPLPSRYIKSSSVLHPSSTNKVNIDKVPTRRRRIRSGSHSLRGWVQGTDGEWTWEEDDPSAAYTPISSTTTATIDGESTGEISVQATPTLPSGKFRPKQSLGQNYLRDGNTVAKIVRAFAKDAVETLAASASKEDVAVAAKNNNPVDPTNFNSLKQQTGLRAVELGPGAGALTDVLLQSVGSSNLQCIEIDGRSVELLSEKHPSLRIHHEDVLQVDYAVLAKEEGGPLSIIGNLPYYITSQILFALADASHGNSVRSATVTMQWEVAQRIVAPTRCKDYGILSVVFQLYTTPKIHFKIPPTVFYPQPKVDSALLGLHFLGPTSLRRRLAGVSPAHLRSVVTTAFQQRRKTVRNGLKKLALEVYGGDAERVKEFFERSTGEGDLPPVVREARERGEEFAMGQILEEGWASRRPEELSPGQFVEVTRLLYGSQEGKKENWESMKLGNKVWRKLKHGVN